MLGGHTQPGWLAQYTGHRFMCKKMDGLNESYRYPIGNLSTFVNKFCLLDKKIGNDSMDDVLILPCGIFHDQVIVNELGLEIIDIWSN